MNTNDVYNIITPRFNEDFLFEHFQDDDDLYEAFDKFMFNLVEEHEIDGYDIIRARWTNLAKGESEFHFTVEGCNKILVLKCASEFETTN